MKNGYYEIRFSAPQGQGYAFIVLNEGVLTGADQELVLFDGTYEDTKGEAIATPPEGGTILVTGTRQIIPFKIEFTFPMPGDNKFRLEVPGGTVSGTMRFMRELPK